MLTFNSLQGKRAEELDSWVSQDATLTRLLLQAIIDVINMHAHCKLGSSVRIFPHSASLRALRTFVKGLSLCSTCGLRENIYYTIALGFVGCVRH